MGMAQHNILLAYGNYRYLKITGLLAAISAAAYLLIGPAGDYSFGGTWLGYVLGIASALILLFQMGCGVAKRCLPKAPDQTHHHKEKEHRHDSGARPDFPSQLEVGHTKPAADGIWRYGGTRQGWLSAHVYFGTALLILASLHSGFQFDWNVHTLSYVLMLVVVANGIYGVYAYLSFPRHIAHNMGDDTLSGLLLKIAELDEMARVRALDLPGDVNALVLKARQETRLGGNFFQQLTGRQRNCPTSQAVRQIQVLKNKYINGDQPKLMADLYSILSHKEELVFRARNEIMLKARLGGWPYFHASLSYALLAALLAHIVSVYFYW